MLIWADFPSGDVGIYANVTARLLDGIYAEATLFGLAEDPDPNVTGWVGTLAGSGGSGAGQIRKVYPAAVDTAGMGGRYWLNNIPVSDGRRPVLHSYRDGSNNQLVSIMVTPTGAIRVHKGERNGGTLLGQTTGPVVTANAWTHIESKVFFDAATGSVEVRVEGRVVLDLENVDTGNVDCEQVASMSQSDGTGGSTLYSLKDLIFWDGTGSETNDFLGPCGVYWRPVSGDVSSGWSRTSGSTDFGLLDESPPDDANYIFAGTPPPAASIMTFDPLPADIVSIRGIISVVRAVKSDGGDGSLQVALSPNGVDWDSGIDRAITTAFTYWPDVSTLSPDTAAPWTPIEFASMEIRVDRTT